MMLFSIENRFGDRKDLREFTSLYSREGIGRTGFMGRGTLMSDCDKAIFIDMLESNQAGYVSTSHYYLIEE